MIHDYSQMMSVREALEVTFDGSKPCTLCHISQSAQQTAESQSPHSTTVADGMEKLLLASESTPIFLVIVPAARWPGPAHDAGLARMEAVPVRPPRV
jgi:hypothetical protein